MSGTTRCIVVCGFFLSPCRVGFGHVAVCSCGSCLLCVQRSTREDGSVFIYSAHGLWETFRVWVTLSSAAVKILTRVFGE